MYDGQPGVRATLREIAFLQINDENAEYPEKAPQSFKDTRVGWCYASQAYIGLRVGLTEGQIQRNIQTFIEDKVIDVRSYIDSDGWHHNEYHVLEQVVTDRQRPENIKEALENGPKRNKRDYKNYNNKGASSRETRRVKARWFMKSHLASDRSHLASHAIATLHLRR